MLSNKNEPTKAVSSQSFPKVGRTFLGVCVYTIAVIALAIMALELKSFYLFCLSTFLFGVTAATMNQFRFAAIESVDENLSATATSAVLIGGLVSAFLGPELALYFEFFNIMISLWQ
jgi:flagellar biosynthesis protein FliR